MFLICFCYICKYENYHINFWVDLYILNSQNFYYFLTISYCFLECQNYLTKPQINHLFCFLQYLILFLTNKNRQVQILVSKNQCIKKILFLIVLYSQYIWDIVYLFFSLIIFTHFLKPLFLIISTLFLDFHFLFEACHVLFQIWSNSFQSLYQSTATLAVTNANRAIWFFSFSFLRFL